MRIKLAIKKTIKYAKGFKSHLSKDEIVERLLSKNIYSEELVKKNIREVGKVKNVNYIKKFRKATGLAQKIEKRFKNILFLGISGSVASGHPKRNDDIDLLVITKNNKLWQTRLFLRWWVFKNNIPHRKYGVKEKKDEFCFNLWLDESRFLLPKNRQNLRNAVDLVILKPLINRGKTYEKFILANGWAKKWVATPYCRLSAYQTISFSDKTKSKKIDKLINCLCFWPQYWYMRGKIKKEQIGLHEAFFHEPMVK